ncbi:MAG: outer membrane beta-barrel protein [Litorimonas sp.]
MKHRLLFAAAATALMTVPSLAHAQDSGVYIKAQGGYGLVADTDINTGNSSREGIVGDVGGGGDWAADLAVGYDFGDNWRIELEGSRVYTDFGSVGGQPFTSADIQVSSLMLNVLYDFSDFGRWEPYVGAGLGFAHADADVLVNDFPNADGTVLVANPACVPTATPAPGSNIARSCSLFDDDTNIAWNLVAGLGYNITDNLTWDTNYRYMSAGDYDFQGNYTTANAGGLVADLPLDSVIEDVATHSIMTGFRYRFGKSTPPPIAEVIPPAPRMYTCWDGSEVTDLTLCPAQLVTCTDGTQVTDLSLCPPQLFLCPDGVTSVSDLAACPIIQTGCAEQFRSDIVYYEFDRAQSAETRNAINRVLDVGQDCQISAIRVVGHTDTSGSMAYNQRLSQRRASDARQELVRQGVSDAMITSEGKGETEPAVQTGDGVREQLNRRTEILVTLSDVNGMMMTN